jgi:hypothetical protein
VTRGAIAVPKTPDPVAGFSPLVRQIVALVGRRADDEELVEFVAARGKKVPATKGDSSGAKNVVMKKHGIEFAFDHDVKHDLYPLLPKTKQSFVPYLSCAWLSDRFPEPRPFGYTSGLTADELTRRVGVTPIEIGVGKYRRAYWSRALDAQRAVVLGFDAEVCAIQLDEARELCGRCGVPPKPVVGVFAAWAAQRELFDATRAGVHAPLLNEVRAGKRKGSELMAVAYPRGLWDVHLIDRPGLRDFAHRWFHNIDGVFIDRDMIAVFGAREGPYGHPEPVLDDDDAKAVKKATRKLDTVFAPWLA